LHKKLTNLTPAPHTIVSSFREIHMKKRSDKNSATCAVAGFAGVIDDAILPSAGLELRGEKEHLIWNQFIRTCQGRLARYGPYSAC